MEKKEEKIRDSIWKSLKTIKVNKVIIFGLKRKVFEIKRKK